MRSSYCCALQQWIAPREPLRTPDSELSQTHRASRAVAKLAGIPSVLQAASPRFSYYSFLKLYKYQTKHTRKTSSFCTGPEAVFYRHRLVLLAKIGALGHCRHTLAQQLTLQQPSTAEALSFCNKLQQQWTTTTAEAEAAAVAAARARSAGAAAAAAAAVARAAATRRRSRRASSRTRTDDRSRTPRHRRRRRPTLQLELRARRGPI